MDFGYRLDFPRYEQLESFTCGFSVAQAVLSYFRRPIDSELLYSLLRTSPENGTSQKHLVRTLRKLKIRVSVRYNLDFESFCGQIAAGKVVIGYYYKQEHWVSIYGYGLQPRRLWIADPNPLERDPECRWADTWYRLRKFGIVCSAY